MSNDRQRRRKRRRQRRPAGYEPAGTIEFPGFMGYLQRNQRAFYLGGIIVLVLSLGSIIFATECTSGTTRTTSPNVPSVEGEATATPTAEAPDATTDPSDGAGDEAIVRSYDSPPQLAIDTSASYEAVIRTELGEVRIELLPGEAPGYVNNFVFLARNRFYEGLTFHRVVPGFVAQAGDPTGTGFGGAGYHLDEEHNSIPFDAGVISMAKAGSIVDGSQFFITLGPTPHLADDFTAFGRVTSGMEVLSALTARDPASAPGPGDAILEIEIIEK